MKGIFILLSATAGVILMSSCKKNTAVQTPGITVFLPRAVVETASSAGIGTSTDSSRYYYDGGNRIDSIVSVTSPGFKVIYHYQAESSFTQDLYDGGQLEIHETFFINSDKQVDSSIQRDDTFDSTAERYIYNSDKQLVALKEYDKPASGSWSLDKSTSYTYNAQGDPLTESDGTSEMQYTYSDKINPLSTGLIYLPVPKYLVSSQSVTTGGTSATITHTYTFDTENRLTTDASVASDGGTDVKTYYY